MITKEEAQVLVAALNLLCQQQQDTVAAANRVTPIRQKLDEIINGNADSSSSELPESE